ncbi:urease subunit beta [Chitinophaga rhizophila]|uniref:Urease subunit beta n=1 Tax=Chitinophaga rhizophila TaxID=2866212 RepID=A0ABS7G9U5_9BACT|nr:urease subunit beta [Chitinophaga rhizophila]MBW8684431.1 urease subunit beta [Chitinophaga rhizophila]
MIPGEYFIAPGVIDANSGRAVAQVRVVNTGDRPVQIGSHCHFFEVNRMLSFNREAAFGMRLNIAAGTAIRFEPGEEKAVELVALGGNRRAFGMNNLVNGTTVGEEARRKAMQQVVEKQFKHQPE